MLILMANEWQSMHSALTSKRAKLRLQLQSQLQFQLQLWHELEPGLSTLRTVVENGLQAAQYEHEHESESESEPEPENDSIPIPIPIPKPQQKPTRPGPSRVFAFCLDLISNLRLFFCCVCCVCGVFVVPLKESCEKAPFLDSFRFEFGVEPRSAENWKCNWKFAGHSKRGLATGCRFQQENRKKKKKKNERLRQRTRNAGKGKGKGVLAEAGIVIRGWLDCYFERPWHTGTMKTRNWNSSVRCNNNNR